MIEKLLEGVDIEWKTLGEVSSINRGRRVTKRELSPDKKYPVFSGGVTPMGFYDNFNQEANTITIVKYGTAGFVNFITEKFWANDVCYCIKPFEIVLNKFLLYYLKRSQNHIYSLVTDAVPAHLPTDAISQLQIPVPPLKAQKKIVRILDTFTELAKELNTELNLRKMQYSYYREALMSFKEGEVELKSLEEIGEFQRGKRFVKDDLFSEGIPCIHYGEMYTHYGTCATETKSFVSEELVKNKNLRLAEKGDVVIVAAGETIEDIGMGTAWLGNDGVVTHDACFSYRSPLNPKYVAYFSRTKQFHDQIRKHIRSGKISAINAKGLGKTIIPVPSKDKQESIVSILDKFDFLTTSISEGLPKEIELRQKQYEYYRDLLLTFPK